MLPFEDEKGNVLCKCEDYHILNIETHCLIRDNKHKIITIVDYVRNQKHCRKVFENILEEEEKDVK